MIDRDEIINEAYKYISKGQIDDAIKEYLKILPYSNDGNIHNTIGDLYLKNEDTETAIKHYRNAADMFKREGAHSKAIALCHKILTLDPEQHSVVIELAELNAQKGFIKQSVDDLIKTAEAYRIKGLPVKAINIYKKAIKLVPSNMDLKIRMADLQVETNHINTALKMYLAIATQYEKNAESVNAEKMYKRVIALDPDNLQSLIHLSRLAEDDQDLELAFTYISKAAALAPDNRDVRFEYDSLSAKISREISDDLKNNQETISIPEAMNENKNIHISRENLNVSDDNTAEITRAVKPESTSTPSMHIESTGSGYAEINETESADNHEIQVVEQHEIHDERLLEEQSHLKTDDSIHDDTLKTFSQKKPVEAEYDRNADECNTVPEEPSRYTSVKDVRRLKHRVKTNWIHVLFILFFVSVTAISFFITFNFIKNSHTVDVETTEPVMTQDHSINDEEQAVDSIDKQYETDEFHADEELPIEKSTTQTVEPPQIIDQEESMLPLKENETSDNDSEIMIERDIHTAPDQESNSKNDNTEAGTELTLKSDTDTVDDTEGIQVTDHEELTIPHNETDVPGIDNKIMIDSNTETVPVQENDSTSDNTEAEAEINQKPDTESVDKTEGIQVIDQGILTLPVRESEIPDIDGDITTDVDIYPTPEKESSDNSDNADMKTDIRL
ncbi:MAG: hypothetical protein JSW20_02930 [Nitrospiraceae bacterium]|nr:MAG: hypothetical protein JSW20_02930 [Nitrospiraceae bacterium]